MTARCSLEALRNGGKAALAKTLVAVETTPDDGELCALLDQAVASPVGQTIGLTGPPGVGKSTLISRAISIFRQRQLSVGVIAVDPSSRRTGGALLGDRTRLDINPDDREIFVRSMAARDRLGGLADQVAPALWLMRALFDKIIIETVGVGQSETDIRDVADTVVLAIQPGAGDSLQYMKAGIVEIPDIAVVTKSDLGSIAQTAMQDLELAMAQHDEDQSGPSILAVSASQGEGIEQLIDAIERHFAKLKQDGTLAQRRRAQSITWLKVHIREQYGRVGLKRAGALLRQAAADHAQSPARWAARIRADLELV